MARGPQEQPKLNEAGSQTLHSPHWEETQLILKSPIGFVITRTWLLQLRYPRPQVSRFRRHNALSQVEQFLNLDFLCSGVYIKSLLSHNVKQNRIIQTKHLNPRKARGERNTKTRQRQPGVKYLKSVLSLPDFWRGHKNTRVKRSHR